MNVITIMSDEHSYQMMGFLGGTVVKTPNLDRLAAESVVFDTAYTPCPVCAPARASFFTGRYVNRLGTWDNATPYDGTVEGISHRLQKNGTEFACIGKTHFHHEGSFAFAYEKYAGYMHRGDIGCYFRQDTVGRVGAEKRFEEISVKTEPSFDDNVLEASLAWLEQHQEKDNWVLYMGLLDPHFPFRVKPAKWDYYNQKIPKLPTELLPPFSSLNAPLNNLRAYFKCKDLPEETARQLLVGYCCMVEQLDDRLGILLAKLAELGLDKTTALLYTSDHGEQSGYHGLWWKCTMFEESAHIPLLLRLPQQQAMRITHPVNLVDIYPTICALTGAPIPQDIDGENLLPLIEGEASTRADFTFSEYHAHGIPNGMYMIRWGEYKYVYYCYDSPQLFHLASDPKENKNLLLAPVLSKDVTEVAAACHSRLLSVCDPYEVDTRAKEFQARMKRELGIVTYESAMVERVPFPEAYSQDILR